MQKHAAILVFLALALCWAGEANGQTTLNQRLASADSLFAARQYTQALDKYLALHESGQWTPAMFLKMAYIQEALGHLGESLYYLNLYSLASHDPQAEAKMEELAKKYRLEGYGEEPAEALMIFLRSNYLPIATLLGALSLMLLALAMNRARNNLRPSWGLSLSPILLLAILLIHVEFTRQTRRAIVTRSQTYLMSGPSAGASVVDIVGEGHLVRIKSRQDVWLQVEWKDGEAFVRDFLVRKVEL